MLKKKTPKIGLGIDIGTQNAAAVMATSAGVTAVESPIDGAQVPTVVYHDEATTKWYAGREAILRSCDPAQHGLLFLHPKRNIPLHARDPIYYGKYSPLEIFTQILIYIRRVVLTCFPELADYPQFGGSKHSADDLALSFTTPALWAVQEHSDVEEAIKASGIVEFDGFIAEPIAAARHVTRSNQATVNSGDRILVADVGAGTSDVSVLEFRHGVYHQLAAASGDGYLAGADFTEAIAGHIAEKFSISWNDVYGPGGLNLTEVQANDRPQVMACWNAAEETKRMLSVLDDATTAVELATGRKPFSLTRDEALALWAPLLHRFANCVAAALDGTSLTFSDIDHFMLVGGASPTPGLRRAMAEAIQRSESEILVCTKSEHVIAAGAAEHALYQDEASQALETGLGFTVLDAATSQRRHLLLIEPGHILPPGGHYLERNGFSIDTSGARKTLVCRPFVCRHGVRAVVTPERQTFLEDTEVALLEEIDTPLDKFPDGNHEIAVGIKADPNRNLWLVARPTSLPDAEPLSIRLRLRGQQSAARRANAGLCVLALDVSSSMQGAKLQMLQAGAMKFLREADRRGVPIAVITFGNNNKLHVPDAAVIAHFDDPLPKKEQAIAALQADGNTPMHCGLDLSLATIEERASPQDTAIIVAFTDGMPNLPDLATSAADAAKSRARLLTVGIGEDVVGSFLTDLASQPTDYYYAEAPEDIFNVFEDLAELVLRR